MKKILFALFLAASALTFSFATTGDEVPINSSEQGDFETDSDQEICYDLKKNLGPVNTGTYRNADRYTNGEVTKVQQFLHDEGFLVPEPTGFFGAKTKAAVIKYQRSKGFDILSGYAGPMTRAAIKADTCGGTQAGDDPIMCTMEARMCEDGSTMPRGPGCGWHPEKCPGVTEINPNNVGTSKLEGYSTCTTPTYTPGVLTNSAAASAGTCTITLAWPTITTDLNSKVLKWQFTNGTTWFGNTYLTDSSLSSKSKTFTVGKTNITVAVYSDGNLFTSKTLSSVCATGAVRDTSTGRCIASSTATGQAAPTFIFETPSSSTNYSVPIGSLVMLGWNNIQNASTCTASGGWSGIKLVNAPNAAYGTGGSEFVTVTVPTAYTLTCTNSNGVSTIKSITVYTQSPATGSATTSSGTVGGSPTFNFTTANYTVPTGTQIRLNWYQIVGATSCIASGGWSGTKNITGTAMNGHDGSSELVTVSTPTTYTLTCTNGNGASTVKSITVNTQSATAASGTPELILKINNSKGPIDAVANRFGGSGTTALDADWTSNVDVTDCSAGPGFRQYQSASTLTQTTARTGTIRGAVAQRTWVSTAPQNFDYTMACKRISASGYSEVLWSNTVRVDVCDVGFHVVRDGSFNGGTCVPDTQATPTCTATQTLTNGVCVDTVASVTPTLTLTTAQETCSIKLNESTCRIPITATLTGIFSSLKYFTHINNVSSPQTTIAGNSGTFNFDITQGSTYVYFAGYYGAGSTNITANKLLIALCATGTTWNGSVCASSSASNLPINPIIQSTKTSVSSSESFTLSWQADNATTYKLKIDGLEKGPYTQTSLVTSLASLGLSTGVHTFDVQGCNTAGCGGWSSGIRSLVLTGGSVSVVSPTVTLNSFSPSTITTGQSSSLSFSSTNATACSGSGLWNGNLGGTYNPGLSTSAMNTPGTFTQSITCTGAGGSITSDTKTLTVTTATGAAIKSVEMILSPKFVTKSAAVSVNFGYNAKGFTVSSCDLYLTDPSGSFVNVGTVSDQYRSWVWGAQEYSRSIKVSCRDASGAITEAVERLTVCSQALSNGTGCSGTSLSSVSSSLANLGSTLKNTAVTIAASLVGGATASAASDSCTNITSNLHRGYETASVSKLQTFLISKGLLSEKASGFFGDLTIEAVKAYQRSVGLPETGMVYNATREAIMVESCQ